MHTQTIILPYESEFRNAQNQITVPFDPDVVGRNPVVFLTPRWENQNSAVGYVPTVLGTNNGTLTIADANAAPNYYLHILLVDPEIDDIHGLRAEAQITPKPKPGQLVLPGMPPSPSVDILTPFWSGNHGTVGSIETVDTVGSEVGPTGNIDITTVSGNAATDYSVNHLSLQRQTIQHAAQSGTINKTSGGSIRTYFAQPWDNPPIVFVTPWWKDRGSSVGSIETITAVAETYFEVTSGNAASDYFVNWLAVTSNPNFQKDHVDAGFKHFLEQFPNQAGNVAAHRQALENAILNDTPPPEELRSFRCDNGPTMPKAKRSDISPLYADFAKLAIDGLGLVMSCVGAGAAANVARKNAQLVNALAEVIENAPPSEITPLFQTAESLAQKAEAATDAAVKAAYQAKVVLGVSTGVFSAGLLKTVISAIFSSLTWWEWVVVAVKLAAQLAALVLGAIATAGTAAALVVVAWIARIVAIIFAGGQVVIDVIKLINDFDNPNRSAAPT